MGQTLFQYVKMTKTNKHLCWLRLTLPLSLADWYVFPVCTRVTSFTFYPIYHLDLDTRAALDISLILLSSKFVAARSKEWFFFIGKGGGLCVTNSG